MPKPPHAGNTREKVFPGRSPRSAGVRCVRRVQPNVRQCISITRGMGARAGSAPQRRPPHDDQRIDRVTESGGSRSHGETPCSSGRAGNRQRLNASVAYAAMAGRAAHHAAQPIEQGRGGSPTDAWRNGGLCALIAGEHTRQRPKTWSPTWLIACRSGTHLDKRGATQVCLPPAKHWSATIGARSSCTRLGTQYQRSLSASAVTRWRYRCVSWMRVSTRVLLLPSMISSVAIIHRERRPRDTRDLRCNEVSSHSYQTHAALPGTPPTERCFVFSSYWL